MHAVRRSCQAGNSTRCVVLQTCHRHAFSTSSVVARKVFTKKIPSGVINHFQRNKKNESRSPAPPPIIPQNTDTQTSKTYHMFQRLCLNQFDNMLRHSESWAKKKQAYMAFGIYNTLDLEREAKLFRSTIEKACRLASTSRHAAGSTESNISRTENPLFFSFRNAFVESDINGLGQELVFAFSNFLMRDRFPKNIAATHRKIADLRFPHEWFPATRAMQRTIHLHVGPTNSGKTYNALKALEDAKTGIYAGPLRLLAHEVYSRFMAKNKPCALITGEEIRVPEGIDNFYRSCTVEMTPLNLPVDVAVIDEIQMIGDSERGFAWTQAFLGVQAKEVHLCGEERAVELIQSLCATIGDKCVIHRYERLSPLETMSQSLRGDFGNLEKGDAVVAFSRVSIHQIKNAIEKITGRRAAVVYGALPPETRAAQAALFNDPNNEYDFLVASDAIGMGLNLEIKRVIFEQVSKRVNFNFRQLNISEMKQIGGRAGRYRTANQAIQESHNSAGPADKTPAETPKQVGLVTTLDDEDLGVIRKGFTKDPEPIRTAGLQPPPSVIERFSTYFPPNTPFSYVLTRLRELARASGRYHLCHPKEMLAIADLIQPYALSVYDRCVFLNAPVFLREKTGAQVLQAMAKCVSTMQGGELLSIPEINLELLEEQRGASDLDFLGQLESLHKSISLYLWLSYRYSGVFTSQHLAFHVKELVEEKINDQLSGFSLSDRRRKAQADKIRRKVDDSERQKQALLGEDQDAEGAENEVNELPEDIALSDAAVSEAQETTKSTADSEADRPSSASV